MVLAVLREATKVGRLVGLVDNELPELDELTRGLVDELCTTAADVREARLFVELSPMTASCAHVVPFLRNPDCATAAVVYDFIPTLHPTAYLSINQSALQNRARLEALSQYDLLMPISEATAADARALLKTKQGAVVTWVADPIESRSTPARSGETRYVLVPGGGDARKNLAAALDAFSRVRSVSRPLQIVFTGALTPSQAAGLRRLAEQLELEQNEIELLGFVTEERLAQLYDNAVCVIVPSHIEGFSIPVVEAVRRGTPVVASDIAVHRELLGAGPWLAPSTDPVMLADALSETLRNSGAIVESQRSHLGDIATPSAVHQRIRDALTSLIRTDRLPARRVPTNGRSRPRIALLSPWPPQRSGVADFTAFTFQHVADFADVEVYSSAHNPLNRRRATRPLSSRPYLERGIDAVVAVIGNSYFHLGIMDLMCTFGGPCIAHDDRMFEVYRPDRGNDWVAQLVGATGGGGDVADFLQNLDALPAYRYLATASHPLIVHSSVLAERILGETGRRPALVPFVPYNMPLHPIDVAAHQRAREGLGLEDDVLELATFGIADRRTKRTDVAIVCASWLRDWGRRVRLHVVGHVPPPEKVHLDRLVRELDLNDLVRFTDHVSREVLNDYLTGVDAAIQLRSSRLLSLSGSLADCIAYGVPTIASSAVAAEHSAPDYVHPIGSPTSGLLVAEAAERLGDTRKSRLTELNDARTAYLAERSGERYARGLLQALELAP
jgi:glycosyltransferase involved in cell wall biosynthesis